MTSSTVSYGSLDSEEEEETGMCNFDLEEGRIITVILLTGVIAMSAILGNSLILYILQKKSMKGSMYILIGNLAVTDFLLGITLLLVPVETFVKSVYESKYFCVVKMSFLVVTVWASNLTIVLMSLDRFVAIMFPLKHMFLSKGRRVICFFLGAIWVPSVAMGISMISGWNSYDDRKLKDCTLGMVASDSFLTVSSYSLLLFCFFNLFIYTYLIHVMRKHIRRHDDKVIPRKNLMKLVLLIAIYVWYALCWLPFCILTLINASRQELNLICLRDWIAISGLVNSATNWIIYGIANAKFRRAIKHTLIPCLRKTGGSQHLPDTNMSTFHEYQDNGNES